MYYPFKRVFYMLALQAYVRYIMNARFVQLVRDAGLDS